MNSIAKKGEERFSLKNHPWVIKPLENLWFSSGSGYIKKVSQKSIRHSRKINCDEMVKFTGSIPKYFYLSMYLECF